MTRPTLPTPLDPNSNNTWGTTVVNAINAVSDTADSAVTSATTNATNVAALKNITDSTFLTNFKTTVAGMFPGQTYNSGAGTITIATGGGTASTTGGFTIQLPSSVQDNAFPGGVLNDTFTCITRVVLHADTAPVGGPFTVICHDDSANVYFTLSLAAGTTDLDTTLTNPMQVPAHTRLRFQITAIGSTTAATGFIMDIFTDSAATGSVAAAPVVTTYINSAFTRADASTLTEFKIPSLPTGAVAQVLSNRADFTTGNETAGAYTGGFNAMFSADGGTTYLQQADLDITFTFQLVGDAYLKVIARGNVAAYNGDTGYELNFRNAVTQITRVNSFSGTLIGTTTGITASTGTTYICRWQIKGGAHKLWLAAGTTLPGSVTMSATDSSPIAGPGYSGFNIGPGGTQNQHVWFDDVKVTSA